MWAKIKDLARTVIRKIFRGGLDLLGAAIAIFKFLLEVLKVPLDLARACSRRRARRSTPSSPSPSSS